MKNTQGTRCCRSFITWQSQNAKIVFLFAVDPNASRSSYVTHMPRDLHAFPTADHTLHLHLYRSFTLIQDSRLGCLSLCLGQVN